MIQRIQTLFLLGALIVLILLLFMPLSEILTDDGQNYSLMSAGLRMESGVFALRTWPVFVLIFLTAILIVLNIFSFKNRKLQIRFSVYSIVLCFGMIGLFYYFWVQIFRQIDVDSYLLKLPVVFPVIAIIFVYLAFRGIRKDEILIRSTDKIR